MKIRPASPEDIAALFEIWLRAVQATHTFLSPDDIEELRPEVRAHLESEAELHVLTAKNKQLIGFMGLSPGSIDSLFLVPGFHRRGGGRLLVDHAKSRNEELRVDVNQANSAARRFYEACGFAITGRSSHDGCGRPFPLLHMRWQRTG